MTVTAILSGGELEGGNAWEQTQLMRASRHPMIEDEGTKFGIVVKLQQEGGTWPKRSRRPSPWGSGRPRSTCDTASGVTLALSESILIEVLKRMASDTASYFPSDTTSDTDSDPTSDTASDTASDTT